MPRVCLRSHGKMEAKLRERTKQMGCAEGQSRKACSRVVGECDIAGKEKVRVPDSEEGHHLEFGN